MSEGYEPLAVVLQNLEEMKDWDMCDLEIAGSDELLQLIDGAIDAIKEHSREPQQLEPESLTKARELIRSTIVAADKFRNKIQSGRSADEDTYNDLKGIRDDAQDLEECLDEEREEEGKPVFRDNEHLEYMWTVYYQLLTEGGRTAKELFFITVQDLIDNLEYINERNWEDPHGKILEVNVRRGKVTKNGKEDYQIERTIKYEGTNGDGVQNETLEYLGKDGQWKWAVSPNDWAYFDSTKQKPPTGE